MTGWARRAEVAASRNNRVKRPFPILMRKRGGDYTRMVSTP